MSLELRPTSKRFYSRIVINGKRRVIALKTEYQGTPPPNLRMKLEGDIAFERSRGKALEEEARLREELQRPDSEVKLRKRVYEAMTGSKFQTLKIADLYTISARHTRKRPWSDSYMKDVKTKFDAFETFLKEHHPKVDCAHQVNRTIAEEFLTAHKAAISCDAKRINGIRDMFKGIWTVAEELELIEGNPFRGIKNQTFISTTKEIFTPEQIENILEEADKDPDLKTVIVTALSTGMRLKDCCLLEWSSIYLQKRLIDIPAQKKNMRPARIPLFGLLEELILEAKQEHLDEKYVFPRIRHVYMCDKQYFSRSFSALLLRIGFTDDNNPETSIRIKSPEGGGRRRPIRSLGALRTTWMTNALNGGISLQDVKAICGSADTEVVLKHYFHSDSTRVRNKLVATMPVSLGGEGVKDSRVAVATDELLKLLQKMDQDNWEFIKECLIGEVYGLRRAS